MTNRSILLGLPFALGLFILAVVSPGIAKAQACCTPPTPPCCTTPHPTPPAACCDTINKTNVHVTISNVNVAVANAQSSAVSRGSNLLLGSDGAYYGGGGGGGGYAPPTVSAVIQGLNLEGGPTARSAYQATRTILRRVVIQAVCLDDRTIPHPASQLSPERTVEDGYEGEIYRCIAGTWLQATIANYDGHVDFTGGQTLTCHKGDALYHAQGGHVECRPQRPARDCNERSLLRRFGAGVKILAMMTTETYTAYRETSSRSEASAMGAGLSLDGGVGGIVY
jgi:hypothetical protein